MCWCTPSNKCPVCGKAECKPPEITVKPPLGVKPEKLWKQQRCRELSRAIYDYMHLDDPKWDLIYEWVDELLEHSKFLK